MTVPFFVFDGFAAVAPSVIGRASIDGLLTTIVSFATDSTDNPIWFRLWVDTGGLVYRAEMRAQNHVMDLRYFDLDSPLSITPPARS